MLMLQYPFKYRKTEIFIFFDFQSLELISTSLLVYYVVLFTLYIWDYNISKRYFYIWKVYI